MMKNLKKKKGFTLIELIIVIAILGILAAIAIPRFGSVTNNATNGAVEANHKTIISAVKLYQAAKAGELPTADAGLDPYIEGGLAALQNKPKSGCTYVITYTSTTSITVTSTSSTGQTYTQIITKDS